ncbi:MAG: group III truncated hemoglobin [Ginsengibacter sp.]|jgi:hemoglobin
MAEKHDIIKVEDVKNLVDTFYGKVREDDLIGPIFNKKLEGRWPEHLAKLTTFWQTILIGEHTYFGTPFPPHSELPIDSSHFERWIMLFNQTVDNLFEGETATEAKWRAGKMSEMFQFKLSMKRENAGKSLI